MDDFMIRFLICNLLVSVPVGILLAARRMLKNILSCRMQYHLWFFMLCLLAVLFLPHRLSGFYTLDSLRGVCRRLSLSGIENVVEPGGNFVLTGDMGWMNDFTLSVSFASSEGFLCTAPHF